MPIIEIHVMEGYGEADKTRLCAGLSDAARLVVPAPPEAVTVLVHEVAASGYMRGRQTRKPAPALPDPVGIIRDFLGAMEVREVERAKAMLGEGFEMVFPGTGAMHQIEELIEWARPRYRFVSKTYDGFDALQSEGDAAIVYARGTLSGEWPDGDKFDGIRFIDRFEVTAGKITRQDVWNDMGEVKA